MFSKDPAQLLKSLKVRLVNNCWGLVFLPCLTRLGGRDRLGWAGLLKTGWKRVNPQQSVSIDHCPAGGVSRLGQPRSRRR